jgi:hypothetical protein
MREGTVRWVCIRNEVHGWVGAGKKVKIVGLTRCRLAKEGLGHHPLRVDAMADQLGLGSHL